MAAPATSATTITSLVPTTTITAVRPSSPHNGVNCSDFLTHNQAQNWFNTYYPYDGDVAQLDRDNDLIACESLP